MWKQLSNYGLKLAVETLPMPKALLGLDLGKKSTGIAITGGDMRNAYLLKTIQSDIRSTLFKQQLGRILKKEKVAGVIIGRPSYVKESQQKQSIVTLIDNFVKQMPFYVKNMPFTFVDESWTTMEARAQLKQIEGEIKHWGHLHKEKDLIDGMAAIGILRRYLDYYNRK